MHFYLLSSEDFNYFSTVYYQRADRKKKHVCGCEGKFAGKGSHTLAFVRWHFPFFFFVFMQQKFHCHTVVVFFSRLACNG